MNYLQHALEPLGEWLTIPDMVEISVNPDGKVWLLRRDDVAMVFANLILKNSVAEKAANLIAGNAHSKTGLNNLLVSASVQYEGRPLRAQAILPPAAHGGTALSLRLFSAVDISDMRLCYLTGKSQSLAQQHRLKLASLDGSIADRELMETLKYCVDHRLNLLVAGGTDTGKTFILRKLLSLVESDERIITIEDARELYPAQPNSVSLIADRSGTSRSPDRLLEAALRMRPDRLIVGEIRGVEAMTFLEAINTGHGGSMSTIHADRPELALDRLAIAAARSGVPMTYDNLRTYIGHTIDVVIQTGRSGVRRGIMEIYRPRRRATNANISVGNIITSS